MLGAQVGAEAAVAGQRRGGKLGHVELLPVDLDLGPDRRRLALLLDELVARRLPDEQEVLLRSPVHGAETIARPAGGYPAACGPRNSRRIVVPAGPCSTRSEAPSVRARSSSTSSERRRRSVGASSRITSRSVWTPSAAAETWKLEGGPRRIASSSASRTIWYRAACVRSPSESTLATSRETSIPCSRPRDWARAS